jgi:hypothetical protein
MKCKGSLPCSQEPVIGPSLGPVHPVHTLVRQVFKINFIIIVIIIIIIIIISCHRFSFFPGTSALEPVVNPTTQASSLSL